MIYYINYRVEGKRMGHRKTPQGIWPESLVLFSKMLVTGYTAGGFIYILLLITMVEILVQVISG